MNHDNYSDDYIRGILKSVKTIAMVGASPVEVRPSYFAFKYLVQRGYDMIPVNPGHVGKSLMGRPFVTSLAEIGKPIDMVEIFRNSAHIMPVVEEALSRCREFLETGLERFLTNQPVVCSRLSLVVATTAADQLAKPSPQRLRRHLQFVGSGRD